MKSPYQLLLWGILAALSTFAIAQEKPADNSSACCSQPNFPDTVMVNGVAEPVYRPGHGVSIPHATYMPMAEYSDKARKKKINGNVMLSAIITSTGEVADVKVEKGLGYGLDEKALEAVRRWKFQPAMKDGKPVSVGIVIETNFRLY